MSLRNKTLQGLVWTFSQQSGVQIINFIVQIILARLLLPEAFGLIAMLQVFVAVGRTLMDGGMTSSLIRTRDVDQRDYSTVFFLNIISSIVIYLLIFISSPYISQFFEQPELLSITRVYCLTFIIYAFVGVQTTRLVKEMKFKIQLLIEIPSTIVGGIVGLTLAYNGYGVWSLVLLHLTSSFINMLLHWVYTKWKPSLIIDKKKLIYHFNFGYKLTISGILTGVYTNLFSLIIGKYFAPTQLGYYTQADSMRMFPVTNLTVALQKVTYPMFSIINDDDERIKSIFKKITKQVFFLILTVMLFLILTAEPIFRFFLTEKWMPSVPYFQILCIGAIVYPISIYNLNIISAKGRSDLHLRMEVIKKVVSISFLLLIIPFGIWGVIYAQILSMFFHAYINMLYSGKLIKYSFIEQLKDLLPTIFIGVITVIIFYFFTRIIFNLEKFIDPLNIIISLTLFFTIYLISSFLFKVTPLKDMKEIILNRT